MKKTLYFLCLFSLLAVLPACSSSGGGLDTPPPPLTSSSETPPDLPLESDNPLLLSEFTVCDVLSGTGKKIGSCGSVSVNKSDLPDLSSVKFSDMLSEFIDRRIINYDGNYVIVDFGDGTGLHLLLGDLSGLYAGYCEILDDSVGASYGYFVRDSLDEPFTYTDFYIRKIPNPTFRQEALVPDNYFEPVDDEIFMTTAEENGLGDTAYYADGEIVSRSDVGGYDTIQVATEEGDLYISAVLVDLPEISDGEAVTVYFVYTGWSDSLGGACGAYVYSE